MCIEDRLSKLREARNIAEDVCTNPMLRLNPSFTGKCPLLLEEFESGSLEDNESLLHNLYLRTLFYRSNLGGSGVIRFKAEDSEQKIRRFLASDPNNYIALTILRRLLDRNDLVESLELEIKMHELDPDCSRHWRFRSDILLSRVYDILENWSDKNGPGSNLSQNSIEILIRKARDTLFNMYDFAIDLSEGEQKLDYALKAIEISKPFGPSGYLARIAPNLETDFDGQAENRSQSITQIISQEFDIDSTLSRTYKLQMMCNDYAFELELEDTCLQLLKHFGLKDADSGNSLANDWSEAAILSLNRLTYDCSPSDWLTGDLAVFAERRCLSDHHESFVELINEVLSRLDPHESNAKWQLLQAYFQMNETSADHFRQALKLDESVIRFATLLSKRLYKRGEREAAVNILRLSISAREQGAFAVGNPMQRHVVENLEHFHEAINQGNYHHFFEIPLYSQHIRKHR